MKVKNYLIIGLILIVFNACLKSDDIPDPDNYFAQFATVEKTGGKYLFDMDNRLRCIPEDGYLPNISIPDGSRVLIYYGIMAEDPVDPEIDHIIKVNTIKLMELKEIIKYRTTHHDSLGKDPLQIVNFNAARHFVNIFLRYEGGYNVHKFNLIEREKPDLANHDTIKLELKHNGFIDFGLLTLEKYISFDLSDIDTNNKDSLYIELYCQDYMGDNISYTTVYYPDK